MAIQMSRSARTLTTTTGAIGGLLVAITAQVLLGRVHLELASVWHDPFGAAGAPIKSALAWWLLTAAALAGGFAVAAVARYLQLERWSPLWLRWLAGGAIVTGLAIIGHLASEPMSVDAAAQVAANGSGMIVSLLGASIGAFFAARL